MAEVQLRTGRWGGGHDKCHPEKGDWIVVPRTAEWLRVVAVSEDGFTLTLEKSDADSDVGEAADG